MSEIILKCINHVMSVVNTPDISSGNVNYDTVLFELCPNWTGYTKTAVFYRTEDEVYYQMLDSNNRCTIPKEVLREKGKIRIGLFGVKDNKTITSDVVTYNVREGAITTGLKPSDPTPDIYAQLIGQYSNLGAEIDLERKRIDSIVSGATVDANAELIDIRVGADGTVYGSAGDAVRSQFKKIKEVNSLAIVNEASGKKITVTDSADYDFKNLKAYGETTQALVEDMLFTASTILFPLTENGITFTPVDNNGITISGTNTGASDVIYSLYDNASETLCADAFVIDTGVSDGVINYRYYEYSRTGASTLKLDASAKSSTIRPNVGIVGQAIRLYVPSGKTINVTIYPTVKAEISPNKPREVKGIKGKNELDCSGLTERTINDVTFTPVCENGLLKYINVNGTCTASSTSQYVLNQALTLNDNKKRTLNGCPSGGSGTTFKLDCYYTGSSSFDDIGKGVTFTARKGENLKFRIVVFAGATLDNVKFYPMLRDASIEDGTYSPYNSVGFTASGAQLLDLKANTDSATTNGFSVSVNSGYIIAVTGTSSKAWSNLTQFLEKGLSKGKYTFSIDKTPTELGLNGIGIKFRKSLADSTNFTHLITGSNKSITFDYSSDDFGFIQIYADGCDSSKTYNFTIKVMLNAGASVLPAEPYKKESANLSGIELHGLGDARDYIDLERGVIVRKIGKIYTKNVSSVYSSSYTNPNGNVFIVAFSSWKKEILWTHRSKGQSISTLTKDQYYVGQNENSVSGKVIYFISDATTTASALAEIQAENSEIYYILLNPIEEPLSDANLQALRELHSYKPTTILTNDAGADMDLEYVADTKLYIDKRISELATAILNN